MLCRLGSFPTSNSLIGKLLIQVTEAHLSKRIQKMCAKVHWQRIENSVGVGAPDLHGCWMGKDLWFELKIYGGARTRASQNVWHMRRKQAGGQSYRLTFHPKHKMLFVSCIDLHGDWQDVDSFAFTPNNMAMFIAAL